MSDTILPWIYPYLISVMQQHKNILYDAPVTSKGKKVQLVKFLTYGKEYQPVPIWAKISDKNHIIPIQFSEKAMQDYYESNQIPFTRLKTAIISIQKYQPAFTPVPLWGKDKHTIAIICHKFHYIGSAGEDIFGSPVPVEKDPDLLEWSIGLNKDGEEGKTFRDRKQAEEDAAASEAHQVEVNVTHAPQTIKGIVTIKSPVRKLAPSMANSNLMAYEKSWVTARKPQFRQPPTHIAAFLEKMPVHGDPETENKPSKEVVGTPERRKPAKHALDLSTSPASAIIFQSREESASPGTSISGWHTSPVQPDLGTQGNITTSPQPSPPTPAQRVKGTDRSLPSSSPPPTSQSAMNNTRLQAPRLQPTVSPLTHTHHPVTHKVSKPPQLNPRLFSTGPVHILAPNSDTSLSLSQSQSQSQDESLKKSYLSQPSWSQLSLLSNRVVYSERSSSRGLRKENLWVLPDNISDKADDEVDDNHSDHGSTHNSLFSGDPSDSENSTSDANHSSLEPIRFREGSFSQTNLAVLREQQPGQRHNDHVPTSMVVHHASPQQQSEEKRHMTPFEGSYGARNGQSIQPTNTTIDNECIFEAQVFNNCVDEIHSEFPISTQSQLPLTSVKRSFLAPANVEENSESSTQVHPPQKSYSPTMSEIVSKTSCTSDRIVEVGDIEPVIRKPYDSTSSDFQRYTNVVTHDAKAWIAPSFFRSSSSININGFSATSSRSATNLKDHSNSLAKRKNPGGLFENIVPNNRTPKQQPPFLRDQNSNPSAHANSSPLSNFSQRKSRNSYVKPGSSFTTESSKLQKRARDSGRVSQTSSTCNHKKRKIGYSPPINGQMSSAESIPSDQVFSAKILGGWHHGLDRPVPLSTIDDPHAPSEEDVVTWHRLKDICLRISRKRETESL